MERLERLARTLVRAADGLLALPPDTLWCLAVLVAAWWLRNRDIGATYRLSSAGLKAEPLFARFDQLDGRCGSEGGLHDVPGLGDEGNEKWAGQARLKKMGT